MLTTTFVCLLVTSASPAPAPLPAEVPPPSTPAPAAGTAPTVSVHMGDGVTVRSADGDTTLQARSRMQFLTQMRGPVADDGETEPVTEMMVRRLRVVFSGTLGSRHINYRVQLGFAPRDMEPDLLIPLRDATLTWTAWRDANIRVGQGKVPFSYERVVSSGELALVDRSIVNAELSLDRDIGIVVSSQDLFGLDDHLGYALSVNNGEGRLRVNPDSGLMYTARVFVNPFGAFNDVLDEVDFSRSMTPRVQLGVSAAMNQKSRRARSVTGDYFQLGTYDNMHAQADVVLKWAGFSAFAEWMMREAVNGDARVGVVDGVAIEERARDGAGFTAQAGYLFAPGWIDVVARFSHLAPNTAQSGLTAANEVVVGVGAYPMEHDLKVQTDVGWVSAEDIRDGIPQARVQAQVVF